MDVEQRRSGLVVLKAKPEIPQRRYGVTEVRGEENRERVAAALLQLWDALDLSCSVDFRPNEERGCHYRLYRHVGEMLLGEDCPEKEILT